MAALMIPLATLVLVSDIAIALFLLIIFLGFFSAKARGFSSAIKKFIGRYSLQFAFLVALVSTLGSLYFSEIAGLIPCELCWFQRIFMYPQALVLGLALFRKDYGVFYYILPMSVIGGMISLYNYYIQIMPQAATCSAGVSCAISPFYIYGYINIAIMALTGFVMLAVIGLVSRSMLKNNNS
jgi:disulfide bond formation protein DsbB